MRKKRERKFRINLKALEETSMFFGRTKNFNKILRFFSSFCLYRAFGFPCLCYSFQVSFDAGFSAFLWLISRFYYWIRRNLPVGRHIGYCFHLRPGFFIDISSLTIYRNFEMFSCLSIFFFLFQECSVVNTLGAIACLGLFPPGGMVSTTRRRFGKTLVEVVNSGEFRFI